MFDPLGAIGADKLDLFAAFWAQCLEEGRDCFGVPTLGGVDESVAIMVDDDHQVAVTPSYS